MNGTPPPRLLVPDDVLPLPGFVRCACGVNYTPDPDAPHDCVDAWRTAFQDCSLALEAAHTSNADLRWSLRMVEAQCSRLRADLQRALGVLT